MTRVLPIRLVSRACPRTFRILCAPVWLRSSRLRRMRDPATSDSFVASYSRLGVPAYSLSMRWNSSVNDGSAIASCQARVSSSCAAISASGMNRPPNRPKWPDSSGSADMGAGLSVALLEGGVGAGRDEVRDGAARVLPLHQGLPDEDHVGALLGVLEDVMGSAHA